MPAPDAELPHVRALRGLRDARAIIYEAERRRRALVVGAVIIGIEGSTALVHSHILGSGDFKSIARHSRTPKWFVTIVRNTHSGAG